MAQEAPSLRDYLAAREADLIDRLERLSREQKPLEAELADVRRAKAALGPEPAPLLEVARRLGTGPPGTFQDWTLKQMVVRALQDAFPFGATAQSLLEYFKTAYGREVQRESLSPQLSRLLEKDQVLVREGRVYRLSPEFELMNSPRGQQD